MRLEVRDHDAESNQFLWGSIEAIIVARFNYNLV
jgi:hypothetical protein